MGKKSRRSRPAATRSSSASSANAVPSVRIDVADSMANNGSSSQNGTSTSTSATEGFSHRQVEALVPGGLLDLYQPRDWPRRAGDPIGDPSLFTMPLSDDSSPGMRSHPCENCGQSCMIIHDNVLCWKCKGAFCLHCTSAHLPGGPNGILNLGFRRIVEEGWGKCPSCTEPLRAIALIPVFRRILEDVPDGQPPPSLVLAEAEHAIRGAIKLADRNDLQGAALEATHAINAINYHSALYPGGKLSADARGKLLLFHGVRASSEVNIELESAIGEALEAREAGTGPSSGVENTGSASTSPSPDDEGRAFRSLFYPLPAAWLAGGSQTGLLGVDVRTDCREVAVLSKQFEDQVSIIPGVSYEVQQQSAQMIPDARNGFPDACGAERVGCTYNYQPRPPPTRTLVEFCGHTVETAQIVQFIFQFGKSSQASEYIDAAIEQGHAGDQGHPFNVKVDDILTTALKERLGLGDAGNRPLIPPNSNIKVLKGAFEMGPMRMFGLSMYASVNHYVTRFWFACEPVTTTKEAAIGVALGFSAKGIVHLYRQITGCQLTSTRKLLLSAAPDYMFAVDICSFCGDESGGDLKRCTGCMTARYCSSGECQKRHWKMKGPNAHKVTCSRQYVQKDGAKPDASVLITPGTRVVIKGLKSTSGQAINGKEGIVLSSPNADTRVELVLCKDVAAIEQKARGGNARISNEMKKLIKLDNLARP
mmetsp:Transcript_24149/g.49819  ORF Transcript_24149/g.49819 Transcript_24149/m.49819 type:complete len:706 (+) Transcript_24149:293-2410(+)